MKPWSAEVGRRPLVVHVQERPGRKNLWLRWWDTQKNNWAWEPTLIQPRDEAGRWRRAAETEGIQAAEAKRSQLAAGQPVLSGDHLGLIDGVMEAIDPDRGLYPVDTMHRRETLRAVTFANMVLKSKPWVAIGPQDVQQVWRAKIRELHRQGKNGCRQAEVVTQRLLTVAKWLAANKRIPPGACTPPHKWHELLRSDWRNLTGSTRDHEPARPRHTVEQVRRILAEAKAVDPRFHLMLWLGLELRLGQVARARRSDVDLEAGTFTVYGAGHKRGTVVQMTAGQIMAIRDALMGYLEPLNHSGMDFPLFPSGQLTGGRTGTPKASERHRDAKPVGRTAIRKWFQEAQSAAGVLHQVGRGLYGFRRAAVDEAVTDLDPEALKRFGGWTDEQMPRQVYKDKQDQAADTRATVVRSRIRGETVTTSVASETEGVAK